MSEDKADYNPNDHLLKSGVIGGEMVQYSQRNSDAGAVVEHPPARVNGGYPMTIPQHTPTSENRQGKRTIRLTPNQVEVPCAQCGTPLYYFPSQLLSGKQHFCDRLCLGKWRSTQTESKAAHWQGGEVVEGGRVYWKLPFHHRANRKGYVARAIIVAELTIGRSILPTEIVHHVDEDPSNDHPDNLQVLVSQAEHARLHGQQRAPEQMAAMRAKRGVA